MSKIPGIEMFSWREIRRHIEKDNKIEIEKAAYLKPHEKRKLEELGWEVIQGNIFVYHTEPEEDNNNIMTEEDFEEI